MEISDNLLTLFSGTIEKHGGSYIVEIPQREIEVGDLQEGEIYRIGVSSKPTKSAENPELSTQRSSSTETPPVEEGDVLDVEIEDVGDQGDGIARVGPGYVVIVPDTKLGERVSVRISETRENVAFADVIERSDPVQ